MKRLLLFCFVIVPIGLFAQGTLSPICWLRADSCSVGDTCWRDMSGNGHPAFFSGAQPVSADSMLNFSPCFFITGTAPTPVIPHVTLSKGRATAIIVYQCADSTTENGLWSWSVDSFSRIGLTTQRILNEDVDIEYDTINRPCAVINSLGQGWHDYVGDSLHADIRIGSADSLTLHGRLSEFVLFDGNPTDSSLVQWLSYLAVKYGITLYRTGYLNSRNVCIWDYAAQPQYSHTIAGIGRDDAFGQYRKQTMAIPYNTVLRANESAIAVFGLNDFAATNASNSGILADGNFILIGLDSNGMDTPESLYLDNDTTYTGYCHGLVQVTGSEASQYRTFLRLSAAQLTEDLSHYRLLIDRSGTGNFNLSDLTYYTPDTIGHKLQYNDVQWDTDGNGRDVFCIVWTDADSMQLRDLQAGNNQPTTSLNQTQQTEVHSAETLPWSSLVPSQGQLRCSLYPNPTSGHYSLEVSQPTEGDITVLIYDYTGKLVKSFTGNGKDKYLFHGNMRVSGTYVIEIRTAAGSRTMRLVVGG